MASKGLRVISYQNTRKVEAGYNDGLDWSILQAFAVFHNISL